MLELLNGIVDPQSYPCPRYTVLFTTSCSVTFRFRTYRIMSSPVSFSKSINDSYILGVLSKISNITHLIFYVIRRTATRTSSFSRKMKDHKLISAPKTRPRGNLFLSENSRSIEMDILSHMSKLKLRNLRGGALVSMLDSLVWIVSMFT